MKLSMMEILVVLIVALLVIGPDKLPQYAQKLGVALKEFRKFSSEATKDIRESIVEPLEEAQKPLKEAMEPITELKDEVTGNVKDLQKSFTDIGKPEKKGSSKATASAPEPSSSAETPVVEKPVVPVSEAPGTPQDSAVIEESESGPT